MIALSLDMTKSAITRFVCDDSPNSKIESSLVNYTYNYVTNIIYLRY